MQLTSLTFADNEKIPERYAFARVDEKSHVALSDNWNPQFSWSDVPDGTQSFVLICVDLDAPSEGKDVNQEGREVPEDLARVDFYHWTLINISAAAREIEEGTFSNGVTPRGKGGPLAALDTRQGINDYTGWFSADRDMNGGYFGYDGPCPPWNDARVHRYVFTLYALSVPELDLEGAFTAKDALAAMKGSVLAEASVSGTYTLNPRLAPKQIGTTSA